MLEYGFNLAPHIGEVEVLIPGTGTGGLPFVGMVGSGAERRMRIDFVRRKAAVEQGLTYRAKFTSDAAAALWGAGVGV